MSDDLLIKFLLKETDPEEDAEVQQWLAKDPENRKEFERFELIWNQSKILESESKADPEMAWERFKQKLPDSRQESRVIPQKLNFSWLKIAAVLFIISTAWSVYIMLSNRYDTISSGELVRTEILPDGSSVTLNKNAVLSFRKDFKGDSRNVRLKQGEVFFDVSPDKSKPFIIETSDLSILVVGTSFNVKQIKNYTEIIVESGIVQVSMDSQQIRLSKGEKIRVKKGDTELVREKSTDKLYQYYRSKQFTASNTPLSRVVEILNEAYQSNIVIEDPAIAALKLNASFKDESLDTILQVIAETFKIRIIAEDDKIILKY
jgi:ferric-dicitrate binding protein FerR (iron transport regulator)